jgi:hypothetical protein
MVFTKLERIVEDIISPATCADSLVHAFGEGLPKPYWNIGLILSAEGAPTTRISTPDLNRYQISRDL